MVLKAKITTPAQERAQARAEKEAEKTEAQPQLIALTLTELGVRLLGEVPQSVRVNQNGDLVVTKKGGIERITFVAGYVEEYKRKHNLC